MENNKFVLAFPFRTAMQTVSSSFIAANIMALKSLPDTMTRSTRFMFVLVFLSGIIFSAFIQFFPEIFHLTPTSPSAFERIHVPSLNLKKLELLQQRSFLPWKEKISVVDEPEPILYKDDFTLTRKSTNSGKFLDDTDKRNVEAEALASLRVAIEMRSFGKHDKALKLFQHAFALHPTHPDILNHYGEFLEEHSHDIILAEHMYSRALQMYPSHSRALGNRQRTLPLVEEIDEERLRKVDQLRDQLIRIPESNSALQRIKKEAYFHHIYHTVGIEGNTMSLSETRSIVETKLAVGGKSIMEHNEILGLDAALGYINKTLVHKLGYLSIKDILEIHRRVMGYVDPTEAGYFRKTQVFVGDHIPPHPVDVPALINEFVDWINSEEALSLHPVKHAALAHYKLVYIHPFTDGNGRTSRLLMNLILMQAGFPPVIIRKQDRQRYYDYLKTANEGDVRPFMRFIAECTERTLDVYLYASTEYPSRDVPALENQGIKTIII